VQSVKIGVVLDPHFYFFTNLGEHAFEQIKRLFDVTQFRVSTCDVILGERIVSTDDQGAPDPFPGAIVFSQLNQGRDTHVGRPGIFRMKDQLALYSFDRAARGVVFL